MLLCGSRGFVITIERSGCIDTVSDAGCPAKMGIWRSSSEVGLTACTSGQTLLLPPAGRPHLEVRAYNYQTHSQCVASGMKVGVFRRFLSLPFSCTARTLIFNKVTTKSIIHTDTIFEVKGSTNDNCQARRRTVQDKQGLTATLTFTEVEITSR